MLILAYFLIFAVAIIAYTMGRRAEEKLDRVLDAIEHAPRIIEIETTGTLPPELIERLSEVFHDADLSKNTMCFITGGTTGIRKILVHCGVARIPITDERLRGPNDGLVPASPNPTEDEK